MLSLQLDVQPQTEHRLKKVLSYVDDQEIFAQNPIAFQIDELKKGILNIRLDLKPFEEKYKMNTEIFYRQFEQGELSDSEDNMIWAGLYEMLRQNNARLRELT